MTEIPTINFQILGPSEDITKGTNQGLWFKLKSDPPPTKNLVVPLIVTSSNGDVKQNGVIMILKHETHSADFFYKTVNGKLDVWMQIETFDTLNQYKLPIFTNEGYVIEIEYKFPEYKIGNLSKIVPYQWNGHQRGLWTDESL